MMLSKYVCLPGLVPLIIFVSQDSTLVWSITLEAILAECISRTEFVQICHKVSNQSIIFKFVFREHSQSFRQGHAFG